MKHIFFHFIAGIIIYGVIGYFIMYFTEPEHSPWFFTITWAISMAIFDLLFFRKNKIDKQ